MKCCPSGDSRTCRRAGGASWPPGSLRVRSGLGVARQAAAKRQGRLDEELERIGRLPLMFVDEVGYIPFDPEAAALFFALVSSRYERSSISVSSNKKISTGVEIFGDAAAAALVDRLVHHAEVLVLSGDSYRLKGKDKEVLQGDDRG